MHKRTSALAQKSTALDKQISTQAHWPGYAYARACMRAQVVIPQRNTCISIRMHTQSRGGATGMRINLYAGRCAHTYHATRNTQHATRNTRLQSAQRIHATSKTNQATSNKHHATSNKHIHAYAPRAHNTFTHTRIRPCTHTRIHAYTHTRIHACKPTFT